MTEMTQEPGRVETREEFTRLLGERRERAGLTVRDVAAVSGVPVATVGGYLSGRHLPPLAATEQFARVLGALGVPAVEQRDWLEAVTRLRRLPGPRPQDAPAPYRGLAAYEPEDAAIFVGREAATAELVTRLLDGPIRPLVVTGPSGSGKSSLLRAGVVAGLRDRGRNVVLATPGTLGAAAETAGPGDVLVVDQLEEVLAEGPVVARVLLSGLASAVGRGAAVVVALRADFFDQALGVEPFPVWAAAGLVIVPPLTAAELRRVVVEPARAVGMDVEPALVDVLVTEAGEGSGPERDLEPGALPLVSHALYVTWKSSQGRRLSLEHYREAGGFRGAVAKTAEDVFGQLSPEQQEAARRILLRLVQVRDGAPDSRRPADPEEFSGADAASVLDAWVAARLVTRDLGRVQLAHEALLLAWPRLRAWVAESRHVLRVRGQLTEAVGHWLAGGRSADLLYRGTTLAAVDELAAENPDALALSAVELEFLAASREAERLRGVARRRAARRLRALAAALGVAALVAVALAAAAWQQSRALAQERDLAVSRQLAVTSRYLANSDPGLSAQVAVAASEAADTVEGRSALLSASSVTPVSRLALVDGIVNGLVVGGDGAWTAAGTETSQVTLWSTGSPVRRLATLTVGEAPVYTLALGSGGDLLLAGGGDQVLRAWDVSTPSDPVEVPVQAAAVGATIYGVSTDPTGTIAAAAASDGTVHLWQVTDGGLVPLSSLQVFQATAQTVAFVGHVLAVAGSEGLLAMIDVTDPAHPTVLGPPTAAADGQIADLDLSADGHTLAAASFDNTVRLWDVTDASHPVAGRVLSGPTTWVNGVAFSPDGTTVAAASSDKGLWTWDLATGAATRSLPDPEALVALAWSPGGDAVYVGGLDAAVRVWAFPGSTAVGLVSVASQVPVVGDVMVTATREGVRIWDASDPEQPREISLASAPDGQRLDGAVDYSKELGLVVAGTRGGVAWIWDVSDVTAPRLLGSITAHDTWIELVDIDDSGTRVALASDDGKISLWDLSDGVPAAPASVIDDPGELIYSAVFSPDGQQLVASALTSNETRLYDVSDLAAPSLEATLTGPEDYAYSSAFSPDGRVVAATGGDGSLWLWDVSSPRSPTVLSGPLVWAEGSSRAIQFSPDGTQLAEAMTDGTVRLWDVTDPTHPRRGASLEGVKGTVYGVAYWPDGRHLAAAGADKSVRVFNTSLDEARTEVCGAATRGVPMARHEWARVAGDLAFPTACG